jgi:hypothetical protein
MSVTGKAAQVLDALLTRLGTLTITPDALPVAWPEVAFDPTADATSGKYLSVQHMPNRPAWEGVASGVLDQGLLQVSVVWPKDQGLIAPMEAAEQVRDHFAKSLVLVSGSTKVTINRESWIAQPLFDTDKVSVPVTVSWTA